MANDDEITSAELDDLLDQSETLAVDHPGESTEIRLYVAVDADTLHELERQANRNGTALTDAASDALRAGAHVA